VLVAVNRVVVILLLDLGHDFVSGLLFLLLVSVDACDEESVAVVLHILNLWWVCRWGRCFRRNRALLLQGLEVAHLNLKILVGLRSNVGLLLVHI
jgi:hypothetical protein